MSHTYFQLLYHLVWSTKDRLPMITPILENQLHSYLGGTFKTKGCFPIQIGGMSDHIHILVAIPPTESIAELVRNVKVAATKWVRETHTNYQTFTWQEGYGAFSVSSTQRDAVIQYIQNQKEHHKKIDFREEFLVLLRKQNVVFEEQYLWK